MNAIIVTITMLLLLQNIIVTLQFNLMYCYHYAKVNCVVNYCISQYISILCVMGKFIVRFLLPYVKYPYEVHSFKPKLHVSLSMTNIVLVDFRVQGEVKLN